MGEEETPLRRFLVDCLCGQTSGAGYLHFKIAEITPVQNLIENLLFTLLQETPNKRKMAQMTMALLFMQLMGHTETLDTLDTEQADIFKVLAYIEGRYVDGSLTELAEQLHYDRLIVIDKPVTEWWKPEDGPKADIADVLLRYVRDRKPFHDISEVKDAMPEASDMIDKLNLEIENDNERE